MINLKDNETISKENFLNGEDIWWIKADKRNKCVVIASEGFKKVCLVDYQGNKFTNYPETPFFLTYYCNSDSKKFYVLN